MQRSFPTILALAALAGPSLAAAQGDEQRDVNLRNDCRLAAQILTTGEPHPHRDWALQTIGRCSQSGGTVIAGLWAAPPVDTASLERLYWTTAGFLDARVLAVVLGTAAKTSNNTLTRLTALGVLAAYVSPNVHASLESLTPLPENPACDSLPPARGCVYARVALVGSVDHRVQTPGTEPFPSDYRDSILRLLQDLASADPDRTVRYAAGRLGARLNAR